MVAAGVAHHSDFRRDPSFAWRTPSTSRSPCRSATSTRAGQRWRGHRYPPAVTGKRDDPPYRALDPELLLWVHATLVDSALVTYNGSSGRSARSRGTGTTRR
ncbi:MAG: oxygenase MpaB family protein [Actinomycetota bacterium]